MPPRRRSASPTSGDGERTIRVNPTDVDPLASLGVTRIAVDIADRRWIIPALEAAEWLKILLDDDLEPERIFPGLCGPDTIIEVNQLIIDGVITMEQMDRAISDTIEAASGRRWWVTLRLARYLRSQWDRVGGELAANGVTPFGVSLSYWLDGAYATCLRLMKEGDARQITAFTRRLTEPPPGMAVQVFDQDRAAEAFKAAMKQAR